MHPLLVKAAPYLVTTLLSVAATAYIGHMVYDLRVQKLKRQREVALDAQRVSLTDEFNQLKAKTDALNLERETRISELNRRLDSAKRVRPNTCTPIMYPPAAPGSNANQAPGQLHGQGRGILAYDLLDLGHDADAVAVDQNTCVDTLNLIYKQNGQ